MLHIAAENNRIGILKRLILDGLDPKVTNERGETALHLAAKEGYKSASALLLSFDANISALDEEHILLLFLYLLITQQSPLLLVELTFAPL